MIKKTSTMSAGDRLDMILDRITDGHTPTGSEIRFLDSYSNGTEDAANLALAISEGTTYLSDDGQFWFRPNEVDRQEDCEIISGVMGMSEPAAGGQSEAHGRILVFKRTHLAIDFTVGGTEIMEAIPGREVILEGFVEEVYKEIALNG